MEEYLKALKYLESNSQIERVDESTLNLSVHILKELYEINLVDAIDCCSKSGLVFLEPKINMNGRQWLIKQATETPIEKDTHREDIVDLKPNFMGLGINLNALFRWFHRK